MITQTLAFVSGVLLLQQQPELPSLLLSAGLVLLLSLISVRYRWLFYFALFVAGFMWATLQAQSDLKARLPHALERADITLLGVIGSLPEQNQERIRFTFHIERLESDLGVLDAPGKARLSWYGKKLPALKVGQRWQLRVRLKRPHGLYNPAGFDYQGWLYQNKIIATGYVRSSTLNIYLADLGGWYLLQRWRERVGDHINQALGFTESAALVRALVIGDRSQISARLWDVFRRTGTNHLMAISGLHIGIIAGLFYFFGQRLWRCSAHCCDWVPAPQAGALVALLGAVGYSALAGFSISCTRALIMIGVVLIGLLLRRSVRPAHSLSLALLLVVFWDPVALLSAGFWLSFGAVAVILFGITGRLKMVGLGALFRVQWAVSLGLAPLLLVWGMGVSLTAPLVNLFVVPLFTFLIVPLVLFGALFSVAFPSLGYILLQWISQLLVTIQMMLTWISEHSGFYDVAGSSPLWLSMIAVAGVIVLLMPRGIPGRWLGAVMLLPLVLYTPSRPPNGALWLTMLDVGQGLSLVLQTRNHTLVYDAGPRFPSGFDAGEAVLLPYLRHQGIHRLDKVVLSNGDMDHRGGFMALLEAFPVVDVISGEPERIHAKQVTRCQAGMQWFWDGVEFSILHPGQESQWQGNNSSCVLMVKNSAGRVLITGDIERNAEQVLVKAMATKLKAEVVLIPHHGSGSSSTSNFIKAVDAESALVSAGYNNRFGFPRPDVTARWESMGVRIFNTASSGAVSLKLGADGVLRGPVSYRQQAQHYWLLN